MNRMNDKINQIADYCEMIGTAPLHPLIHVVDFSRLPPIRFSNLRRVFGYYAIYLKEVKFTDLRYGMGIYEYQPDTLVCLAPGQVAGSEDDGKLHQVKGHALLFHPDLLKGTYLLPLLKDYTYFDYSLREAIQLDAAEKQIFLGLLHSIEEELKREDASDTDIVIDYLKLLLDYCRRFYERQFDVRQTVNKKLLERFDQLLNHYFASNKPLLLGVPTVAYCAGELCLSTNYFSDLVKKATGLSPLKHIHLKMLHYAKELLTNREVSLSDIAGMLGFQYAAHFSTWFKKQAGCTPLEYRNAVWQQ